MTRALTTMQYFIPGTLRAQFESCDIKHCLERRGHFHFGKQIPCNGANDPQLYSDSPWHS